MGIFFNIEFGIFSSPGVLLLANFLGKDGMFLGQDMYIRGFEGFHICL